MAVNSSQVCSLPASGSWFSSFLPSFIKDELKPYPGRVSTVTRMVIATVLTMLVVMTMRCPNSAVGIFFSMTISRENRASTIKHGMQTISAFILGLIYVLVGVTVFINDPLPHFLFIAVSLALMFFIIRTFKSYSAAFGFCFVVVSAIPIWDLPFPVDAHVDNNIWLTFGVILSICITMAVELILCPRQTDTEEIQNGLADRLACLQALLQVYLNEKDISSSPELARIKQLARLGTGRLKEYLARSDMEDDAGLKKAEWGALISAIERLVDTASNLGQPRKPLTARDKNRLHLLQDTFDALREAISRGEQWPLPDDWHFSMKSSLALPLLPELERKLELLPHMPDRTSPSEPHFHWKKLHWRRLFVADAFVNPDYLHFAVKGMLTGLACYVFYSSVDWPGLGNSLATCVITALSTVGSSRQKQILRIGGAIAGGLILGMGSQMYVLPYLDTIFGFTMLFALVTAISAWFTTSSPRLSYFGLQMALAFYLIMFQSSAMETSLLISRDRVIGTLLGLLAMWSIFDQLWAKPAIQEIKDAFSANMRHLGKLCGLALSGPSAMETMDVLREQINGCFTKMDGNADMIFFETGRRRAEHLYWRSRMADWQNTQESLFLAQLAVNHYRSHLSISEWPENLRTAFLQFNDGLIQTWDAIGRRVAQAPGPVPEEDALRPLLLRLRHEAFAYLGSTRNEVSIHVAEAILDLDEQMVGLTETLMREVKDIPVPS